MNRSEEKAYDLINEMSKATATYFNEMVFDNSKRCAQIIVRGIIGEICFDDQIDFWVKVLDALDKITFNNQKQ